MSARDYRDEWDDSETGGRPCACGRQCAEGDYQGNPKPGPRAFCDTDRSHIGAVIRGLPETYVELRLRLAKTQQQEERVSGSREAKTPLDLEVEAFMRHIILVAASWEEQVRAVASLSDPDACRACGGDGMMLGSTSPCPVCRGEGAVRVRDGAALQRACRLLGGDHNRTGYLDTLLSLEPEDKRRPVPGTKKISELTPGSHIIIDMAGDAWENRESGGSDAGLEFLSLSGRARGILGLSLHRRRVAVRCDGCDGWTLTQREAPGGGWEPVVKCTACPQSYIGNEFELLMGREYSAGQKAARASLPRSRQVRRATCADPAWHHAHGVS